jgi:hypothetical protein
LALAGHPARQVREPGPGFSTGLLSGRKGVDIPVDSRCAAFRPRLTAAQGTPGRAAGHRGPHSVIKLKSNSKASLLCCLVLDLALLKSTRRMRVALPGGPSGAAGGWRISPQGGRQGCRPVWRQHRMCCRQTPEPDRGPCGQGRPQGAQAGWPSLWLLSLGHARESDSPSAGGRKLFAPTQRLEARHWISAFAGMTAEGSEITITATPLNPKSPTRTPPPRNCDNKPERSTAFPARWPAPADPAENR